MVEENTEGSNTDGKDLSTVIEHLNNEIIRLNGDVKKLTTEVSEKKLIIENLNKLMDDQTEKKVSIPNERIPSTSNSSSFTERKTESNSMQQFEMMVGRSMLHMGSGDSRDGYSDELQKLRRTCDEQNSKIILQEEVINNLKRKISSQEEIISDLKQKISYQESMISSLQQKVNNQDAEIRNLRSDYSTQHLEVRRLEADGASKTHEIMCIQSEITRMKNEKENERREREAKERKEEKQKEKQKKKNEDLKGVIKDLYQKIENLEKK